MLRLDLRVDSTVRNRNLCCRVVTALYEAHHACLCPIASKRSCHAKDCA